MDLPDWPLRSLSHKCTQNEVQSLNITSSKKYLEQSFSNPGVTTYKMIVKREETN